MVKVIVRKASTGALAASTLLVATGSASLSCTVPVEDLGGEPLSEAEDALITGSGTIELGYTYGTQTEFGLTLIQSTTDEFIRVGEKLTVTIPAWLLWQEIYPQEPLPDTNRLKKLSATITVHFYDKTLAMGSLARPIIAWSGADPYDLDASTGSFFVPAKADSLRLGITVTDAMNPGATTEIQASSVGDAPIFAGELPKKTILFDNNSGALRQRVIEGDNVVAGSTLLVAYTDWRADQLVNKGSIDTQIGKAQTATRFGMAIVPIFGTLLHEVSYAIFFNDPIGWRPEAPLAPNALSRILGAGRTSFETSVQVPAKATKMSLYAHVKTYLYADYTGISNVIEQWYADDAKILKGENYDNPYGPFTNYDYSLQK